jgi:hypothetical protein
MTSINRTLRAWLILWTLLCASACSHQPQRVDCNGRLEPINATHPVKGLKPNHDTDPRP